MKRGTLRIFLAALFVCCLVAGSYAEEALKAGAADIDKGWKALDIPLLEKTVKTLEDMASKNPNDAMIPVYWQRLTMLWLIVST